MAQRHGHTAWRLLPVNASGTGGGGRLGGSGRLGVVAGQPGLVAPLLPAFVSL